MTEVEKLRSLLAEAHDRLRKARYLTPVTMSEQIGDLVGRIDTALAEPVDSKVRLTDEQVRWVVRLCKAAQLWEGKASGAFGVGLDTDSPEFFDARELSNRVLMELRITAAFPVQPEPKRSKP
jgi:hypothetical protein